jgi:hypothetical protein
MKPLSQDSRSPDRDLNPGLSEYEAGVLTLYHDVPCKPYDTAHMLYNK